MKKIKLLIILVCLVSPYELLMAQVGQEITKVGTTAAQFLKIGPGARALGMGGTYAAVSDDIYAAYWNPAGLAVSKSNTQVTFNHSEWLAEVSYDFAAASFDVADLGSLFLTVTSLGVPEDKVRTEEFPEGDGRYWDASSLAIGVGYAKSLTDRFSIGFHAKYLQETIWNSSANGFALDVGTYYITPFNDLVIGASVSNFGTKMQLDGRDIQFNNEPNSDGNSGPNNIPSQYSMESFDIPLTFRIGLAMDVIKTRFIVVKTAVDATHPNDNTEYVNSGIEFAFNRMFFLRAGYKSLFLDDSEQGLTLGAGLNYETASGLSVSFNYAYADYNRLKDVQYFDVSIAL